jgi:UDP-glucuronate decarboxylase
MRPDDGRVIPNFLSQALRGDDLTVYGDGSQTRSFCYIDDLVRGIRAVADAPSATVSGEVINLGSTDEIAIRELADVIIDAIDPGCEVVYQDLPADDPQVRRPDISRAEERLDWTPTISLSTGIENTIPYFESELGITSS